MAESDRRNPRASTATRIDGATAPGTQFASEQTVDGKFRFVERLDGNASVTIARERVFTHGLGTDLELTNQFSNLLVITTTGRDDTILIEQRNDGMLDINVNGKGFLVSLAATQDLAIRTRGGNDTVIASERVTVNVDLDGGDQNDVVVLPNGNHRIEGGAGDDTIWLGNGTNYANGGAGDDVIRLGDGTGVGYGGAGNDILYGGAGFNYLDGGKGSKDLLFAGPDRSVLSGVSDKTQAALGAKSAKGGRIYTSDDIDPSLGSSIKIVGTPAFRERVGSDIDTLRSSPAGKQMLAALDRAATTQGNSITIAELTYERNGFAIDNGDSQLISTLEEIIPGTGSDATIKYNPSFFSLAGNDNGFPPIVVLYHELSHAYNIVTGTYQPGLYTGPGIDGSIRVENRERQAVGLSNDGVRYDFDGNPNTPATTANPRALTENGIRQEMGLPLRESYGPKPPPSTESLLNRMVQAALDGNPTALLTGLADLLASSEGQKFTQEGIAALETQATPSITKDSPDLEPTTPKIQPGGRSR